MGFTSESDNSNFESMSAKLSGEERRDLLNRVGAKTSTEEENTLKKSTADRAYKNDGFTLMSGFSQEPLLVKILLWIKSILFDTDIENVYNSSMIRRTAAEIRREHPGLIDYKRKILAESFCDKIQELRSAQVFFRKYVVPLEKNAGNFYILLSSLVMSDFAEGIKKACDPFQYPADREPAPDTRSSLLSRLSKALDSIPPEKKSLMYGCARAAQWLRAFTVLPTDSLSDKFVKEDGVKHCGFVQARSEFSSFAQVLDLVPDISMEFLKALYLFSVRNTCDFTTASVELSDEEQNGFAKFYDRASASLSAVTCFVQEVPMASLAKVIFENFMYEPPVLGGGETWSVKFREKWKAMFDARWEQWTSCIKKDALRKKLAAYFELPEFPLFPVRPWENVWDGVVFAHPLTLGFLYFFMKRIFKKFMPYLRAVTLEGEFSVKDNNLEFTDTMSDMEKINFDTDSLINKLSSGGEYGSSLSGYSDLSTKTASSEKKVNAVIEEIENSAEYLIVTFCKCCRSFESLLDGITGEKTSTCYGPLANLSKIMGKDNAEFCDSITAYLRDVRYALDVIMDMELIEKSFVAE